ncbi:hypothetical protein P692DRAFT_20909705 [Suillus brevipes Sb2]|nr:hypothetical protein P692DRAFT_20909705 [Suillus brevipes Sb2]
MTGPEYGGDTLWSSGSHTVMFFIPPSVHECRHTSRVSQLCTVRWRKQRDLVRLASTSVEIEIVHPVVRVHPVTDWKSVYVDPASHSRCPQA